MQINILGPKEARPVSKSILVFILAILCCFMCMSFTINKNDGNTKQKDKSNVIAPSSSIGPSEISTIAPSEDNVISPVIEEEIEKPSENNISSIKPINYEFNPTSIVPDTQQKETKPEQVITNSIQPSISPSSIEIQPSTISPTIGGIQNNVIGEVDVMEEEAEIALVNQKEVVKKQPSFQLVSNNYMNKQRHAKMDNTKTKSASIFDMINEKDNKSKRRILESFSNHNDTISSTPKNDASINWLTWDEAMKKNAVSPRKIMVELYTDWCTWCVKMDKSTFQDPAIVQYINDNFYAVKFNAETREIVSFKGQKFGYIQDGNRGYNLFSIYLTRGKLTFPSIVFLDETVNNPQPIKGFQSITVMERLLQYFGENYYKKMDWSLFNQSFDTASK